MTDKGATRATDDVGRFSQGETVDRTHRSTIAAASALCGCHDDSPSTSCATDFLIPTQVSLT